MLPLVHPWPSRTFLIWDTIDGQRWSIVFDERGAGGLHSVAAVGSDFWHMRLARLEGRPEATCVTKASSVTGHLDAMTGPMARSLWVCSISARAPLRKMNSEFMAVQQERRRRRRSPHLQHLEDEAIRILREVVAEFRKPVMLYSVGKDSSVMLHLARKAFRPAPPPFPFLHIASGWNSPALVEHRDRMAAEYGLDLMVHCNEEADRAGVSPFDTETGEYTRLMLTEALKSALDRMASMLRSAAAVVTRTSHGPRNASFRAADRAMSGNRGASSQSSGACSMRSCRPARRCGCFPCQTGPNSTCGLTSSSRRFRSCRFISRPNGRSWNAPAS